MSNVFASIGIIFHTKKTNPLLSQKKSSSKFQSRVKHGKKARKFIVFLLKFQDITFIVTNHMFFCHFACKSKINMVPA